jgi:cell division protease FtsH
VCSSDLSQAERERTAYHEAGHAIVGMLTPGADPVRKVSIIPRGIALGVTLSAPAADRFSYDERYLHAKIKTALGGRVAEQVVLGDMTTGAESDIQQLTLIARQMVGRWGMSEAIGPIAVIVDADRGPLLPGVEETSQHTQELVDREVRRIVDEAYQEVVALITANRDKLESLARALLREETLDEREAYAAAGIERIADEPDGHAGAPAPPAVVAIDYPGSSSHPLGEETP